MGNERKIVLIGSADWFKALFLECKGDNAVIVGDDFLLDNNDSFIGNFIRKVAFSRKMDDFWGISFLQRILIRKMCKVIANTCGDGSVFVVNRSSILAHNVHFLKALRKVNNTYSIVYWFTDIVSAVKKTEASILQMCQKYCDCVITYSQADALEHDLIYIETPYSYERIIDMSEEVDLLFIGASKLNIDNIRFDEIIRVFEAARKKKLTVAFYIAGVPEGKKKYQEDIEYIDYLPYKEVVKLVCKSKCILEVSQEGETGTTLRMFESIAYGKRLLTTNPLLVRHPLFDERFMKIIEINQKGEHEIDKDFVLSTTPTDYHEDTIKQLSPYRYIDAVIAAVEKTKKI